MEKIIYYLWLSVHQMSLRVKRSNLCFNNGIATGFALAMTFQVICGLSFALEIKSVSVTDQLGAVRTNYSNTEKLNFNVSVYNNIATDRINFKFEIKDPAGAVRFTHTGNSIPGTIGEGGSSVKFVPITSFFTTSGNYKLVVTVNCQPSTVNAVTKETTFAVYSPNITLTYPSNYAKDLTDKPLIFRWVASGAAKYRIYVDDDAAFFNCLFTAETTLTQYTYPDEPADTRQKLSGGIVYYWKVEGLDASGNIVAQTPIPFNFTIKSVVLPTPPKDLAIMDITADPTAPKLNVSVKNQGGKTESSIPVTLYLNGMLVGTHNITTIAVGETKTLEFLTTISGPALAMATLTFEDDYSKNNTLTKQITIYTPPVEITEKAKILGTVMTVDGKKIADAIVVYSGPTNGSVYTNPGGEYKIEDLELGEYTLKASASGYIDLAQIVNITQQKAYPNVDFKLKPVEIPQVVQEQKPAVGTIKGRIADEENKGQENVYVVLLSTDKTTNILTEVKKLASDKNGYYKFENIPVGEYILAVAKEGYHKIELGVILSVGGETKIKDIKLVKLIEKIAEKIEKIDYAKSLEKLWTKLKDFIKDEKLISQLEGYELAKIETVADINKIVSELETGETKIVGLEIISE